jgi:microcompartment protein CcmL/EutN
VAYAHEPTIGLLEFASIARGIECVDRVLKEALVRVLFARPVTPGKYVVAFTGSVDDVDASLRAAATLGADALVDRLFLPAVHDAVLATLERPLVIPPLEAVGVLETATVASTLLAADVVAKTASVTLFELQLAQGIGGKSFVSFCGAVDDVEVALDAGAADAERRGLLIGRVLIPRAHEHLRGVFERHDRPLTAES